jgi:hypothetical protein
MHGSPDRWTQDSTCSTADHPTDVAAAMRESYLNAEEIGNRIEKPTTAEGFTR